MISYYQRRLIRWRLVHLWSVVRLRRRIALLAFGLIVVIFTVWTVTTTPVYSSRAVVYIDGLGPNGTITNEPHPILYDSHGNMIY